MIDNRINIFYNIAVHEKNELLNYRPLYLGGFYAFVFSEHLLYIKRCSF